VAAGFFVGAFGRFGGRLVGDFGAEKGAGGGVGESLAAGGFVEGEGLLLEDLDGALACLCCLGGGAAEGEGVELIEEFLDGGLVEPYHELLGGELVGHGDADERFVGFEEVEQELLGVYGDAVDLVVDGGLERRVVACGEHGWKLAVWWARARGP